MRSRRDQLERSLKTATAFISGAAVKRTMGNNRKSTVGSSASLAPNRFCPQTFLRGNHTAFSFGSCASRAPACTRLGCRLLICMNSHTRRKNRSGGEPSTQPCFFVLAEGQVFAALDLATALAFAHSQKKTGLASGGDSSQMDTA